MNKSDHDSGKWKEHVSTKKTGINSEQTVLSNLADKFSKGYERGKFYSSTQHPTYMLLIPEAQTFSYLVSNGMDVWTECYRRDETPDIRPIIADFFDWLDAFGLMDVFKEHWKAL